MKAINWNDLEDPVDKQVWERLTSNFWLDTKVPVSNDLPSWRKMTKNEQEVVKKVFASLTLFDTLQQQEGAPSMGLEVTTPHAKAVFSNIEFMEAVHAKSYSTIFSTLCSGREIEELFRWAEEDELLQKQAKRILEDYHHGGPYALVAGVLLESFLFYSGFYAPLRLASEGRLTNSADIIRLIMRDEGVHGYYAGYWLQKLDSDGETREYAREFVQELLETELERSEQLYDKVGWTEDVKHYLRYNANKALANLGIEPLYPREQTKIPAYILSALDPGTAESHDFFSGSGTTAHAVMRLNKQDGGRRQCISVTNNEVSAEEQKGLRAKGLRPGDPEWEQWGICDYITKPRVTAAITGKAPAGEPIKGKYKFTDEFPMADGFEENAAFFTLTYEAPRQVRRNRAFARVAPMLWLKAGSRGRIISSLPERGWDVAQAYGVLEDMDHAPEFLAALEADPQVGMAFIVTDSEVAFQSVARQLPEHTTAVRLYESYLHNFQINRRA